MPPVIQNVIPNVIPLLQEHPLSVDDQRSLRCLVALMIPASAKHAVPGGDIREMTPFSHPSVPRRPI